MPPPLREKPHKPCPARFRDWLLTLLSHKIFVIIAGIFGACVVGWGAFFAMLLIGIPIFPEQDKKEFWMNFAIQVLTALFTYVIIVTLPWRLYNLQHMMNAKRSRVGLDFDGMETNMVWFHIPRPARWQLIGMLLMNTLMQSLTQVSRIVYPTYADSQTLAGGLFTNATFFFAFLSGVSSGIMQLVFETRVRLDDPRRFDRSPFSIGYPLWVRWRNGEDTFTNLKREYIRELREVVGLPATPDGRLVRMPSFGSKAITPKTKTTAGGDSRRGARSDGWTTRGEPEDGSACHKPENDLPKSLVDVAAQKRSSCPKVPVADSPAAASPAAAPPGGVTAASTNAAEAAEAAVPSIGELDAPKGGDPTAPGAAEPAQAESAKVGSCPPAAPSTSPAQSAVQRSLYADDDAWAGGEPEQEKAPSGRSKAAAQGFRRQSSAHRLRPDEVGSLEVAPPRTPELTARPRGEQTPVADDVEMGRFIQAV